MLIKNKNINVIISLGVAFLTIIWLVIIPQAKFLHTQAQQIKNEKNKLLQKNLSEKNIRNLRNELKNYDKITSRLETVFIYPESEIDFITSLEKIATKNKVEESINLSDPQEEGGTKFKISTLNLNLKGNFKDVTRYLADLENLDYYINILQISLVNSQKQKSGLLFPEKSTLGVVFDISHSEEQLNINITAEVYWR